MTASQTFGLVVVFCWFTLAVTMAWARVRRRRWRRDRAVLHKRLERIERTERTAR